jgi:NlpC/P60 family
MLRVFLLITVLALAACSSAPTRRESSAGMPTGAAPRAFKPPASLPVFVDHSVGEEEVSIQAMSLVGVPYRWGGNTPDAGFDCSGLVRYVVARAARVDLPRTTGEMSLVGNSIEPDEVAPGDLIFFNTTGRPHSHVGIYVGGYRFVNAPSTGGTVRIDYISNPYWAKRFDGIRRVASTNKAATPFDAPRLITSTSPEPATPRPIAPVQTHASAQEQLAVQTRPTPQARTTPSVNADAFEPPPSSRVAAQAQASAQTQMQPGTVPQAELAVQPSADAFEPPPPSRAAAESQASAQARFIPQTQAAQSPSSADAFEPPAPSRAAAESQAVAEHASAVDPIAAFAGSGDDSANPSVGTRDTPQHDEPRANPPDGKAAHLSGTPAPADDPIARFATGG